MDLPDLKIYRLGFEKQGITLPLSVVKSGERGLLKELPVVDGKYGWPWTEETDPATYHNVPNWPKITIVTPSYNQAGFIEETIRSVLLQNYPNLEYLILDGGSTDGTKEILERYSPWLSYWQSERDSGQGNAINQGFSLASGVYYAWINSDDYYLKNVFEKVIRTFIKTEAEFVYGYGFAHDMNKNALQLVEVLPFLDIFRKIPSLVQPSTFWKSTINQPIWEQLNCSIDYELWIRLVHGRRRHRIKEALSVAYVHDQAKTTDPKMKQQWHEDHLKIWSDQGHGPVPEWRRIMFLNRIRLKLYKLFNFK